MALALVLKDLVPPPIFGWLGVKRVIARRVETLDEYDAHLFAFADQTRPAFSRIADAYYDGGELSPDDARTLLAELRDLVEDAAE